MNLYNAYITSLDLALKRDPKTDSFVISKTVMYLEKAVVDIGESDRNSLKRLGTMLDEYLELDEHVSARLELLFGENGEDFKIYSRNLGRLRGLSEKINSLLSKTQ